MSHSITYEGRKVELSDKAFYENLLGTIIHVSTIGGLIGGGWPNKGRANSLLLVIHRRLQEIINDIEDKSLNEKLLLVYKIHGKIIKVDDAVYERILSLLGKEMPNNLDEEKKIWQAYKKLEKRTNISPVLHSPELDPFRQQYYRLLVHANRTCIEVFDRIKELYPEITSSVYLGTWKPEETIRTYESIIRTKE
jgi:hypothetical protein